VAFAVAVALAVAVAFAFAVAVALAWAVAVELTVAVPVGVADGGSVAVASSVRVATSVGEHPACASTIPQGMLIASAAANAAEGTYPSPVRFGLMRDRHWCIFPSSPASVCFTERLPGGHSSDPLMYFHVSSRCGLVNRRSVRSISTRWPSKMNAV